MAIIGIDLGTTNSLVAYWKSGEVVLIPNSFGNKLTPSVVSVMEEEILVGRAAKERKLTHEGETAASFKRFMGTKKKYELGKQIFTPAELSALVLKKLRQDAELYLNEPVEEAVITVPAYFNDKQRTDTKLAAKLAGLKVERLINEPSAAALAYQVQQKKEEACLLVFDFGGGTLDISLVECFDNVIEIEAVAGDNHLGGDDIDELIYNDFMQHHVEAAELNEEGISGLKKALTEAKSALGTKEETAFTYTYGDIIIEGCITQEQLLELCLPVLIRIRHLFSRVLRDGQCIAEDIDDVIMVGGSSKLHLVQRFIEELFQKPPVVMADTDEVVAQGVGIYAGIRMRDDDIKDHMMTDVCPFTLGTNVVWGKEDDRAHICPVLERNCPLPFSKTVTLRTVGDYQYLMQIGIYQGEEYYADENVCLGELIVPIREKPAGEESVSVTFSYDINGVLKVEGRNSMNQTVEKLIANEELSEEEIEESLKRLEQLKVPDREEEEYQMLLARLGWLYEQQVGNVREWTGSVIYGLTQARKNGKHHLYRKAKERAEGWLIREEASLDMFDSFRTEAFYEEEEAEDE